MNKDEFDFVLVGDDTRRARRNPHLPARRLTVGSMFAHTMADAFYHKQLIPQASDIIGNPVNPETSEQLTVVNFSMLSFNES